jgi:hypothetical protein
MHSGVTDKPVFPNGRFFMVLLLLNSTCWSLEVAKLTQRLR